MRNFFEKLGLGVRYLIGIGLIVLGSLYAYHLSSSLSIFFAIVLIFSGLYMLPVVYEVIGILSKTFVGILILLGLSLPPGLDEALRPKYDTESINYYEVTTSVLNVREGKGIDNTVIGKLQEGSIVEVLEFSDDWGQINYDGKIGYISREFVEKYKNPDGWTTFLISAVIFFVVYFKMGGRVFSSSDGSGSYSNGSSNYRGSNSTAKSSSLKPKPAPVVERKPRIPDPVEYICKHCGRKESNLFFLTQAHCSKSPSKFHQPFEGGIQKEYACKHCGKKESNLFFLTQAQCSKSPSKFHQPFEGGIQKEYACKHCGRKESSLFFLTQGTCSKSPTKHHQPLYV